MNNNYKVVLLGDAKYNRCKCINCHYDINSIYRNYNYNKSKKEIITPEFRQVIQENFSKGKYFS